MSILTKSEILIKIKELKPLYEKEGIILLGLFGSYARDEATKDSDIDILIEAKKEFALKYGFASIERIKEIESELKSIFGVDVDIADKTGMGKTAKKFIIDKAIYV